MYATLLHGTAKRPGAARPGGLRKIWLANRADVAFTDFRPDGSLRYLWPKPGKVAFELWAAPEKAGTSASFGEGGAFFTLTMLCPGFEPSYPGLINSLFGSDLLLLVERTGQQLLELYGLECGISLIKALYNSGTESGTVPGLNLQFGNNAAFPPNLLDPESLRAWLGAPPELSYSANTRSLLPYGMEITLTGQRLLNTLSVTLAGEEQPFKILSAESVAVAIRKGQPVGPAPFILSTPAGQAISTGTHTRVWHS